MDSKNNEPSASTSTNIDSEKEGEAPESKTRKLMHKDDSGISVEKSGNSSGDDVQSRQLSSEGTSTISDLFPKMRPHSKTRNYRKASREVAESSSEEEVPAVPLPSEAKVSDAASEEHEENASETSWPGADEVAGISSSSSSSSTSRSGSPVNSGPKSSDSDDEDAPTPAVLQKQKPKHKWSMVNEVLNRQQGVSSYKHGPELMHARFYGSLHSVQRLELMYKLQEHHGCVNALSFNASGTQLASGSDDLRVVIWDWARGQALLDFESGHRNNVFQAKFMPFTGDTHIVTCARDGQVRLAVLSATGKCRSTRRLAQHNLSAHKLAVQLDPPQVVLSTGEDAQVMSIDLREPKPTRLLYVKEGSKKIAMHSISSNPLNYNEFCVGGKDQYVRIYDKRRISESSESPMKKFCPHHLQGRNLFTHVTCAVFNHDGSEIVATYNDDDIFLFDTRHSDGADYVHKYEGHRNSSTVKGVNFFGPKSEFIVSGSDCGNVFFWDKHTESIVQFMHADENGVVNCLEPHPHLPVLATSGLDDDVKIWVPSFEQEPELSGLKSTVISNQKSRDDEQRGEVDPFDGQMLWFLWRQIRRTHEGLGRTRRQAQEGRGGEEQNNSSSSEDAAEESDDDDDDEGAGPGRVQCSPS